MSSTKDLIKYYYEARDAVNVRVQLLRIRYQGLGAHILDARDNQTFCEIDLNTIDQSYIELLQYRFTECLFICRDCLKAARS